jgi:tetratricopeptide (TPR) repeat protein
MLSVDSNRASQIFIHYKTGVRLFDEKNYQAAMTELQIYLDKEQHPEVDAYLYLGKALFLTGQQIIAIDQLRKFITKSESANLPYAYDLLGQCYAALNDISNATINYQLATQMEPACASAWHNWGLLHMTSADDWRQL